MAARLLLRNDSTNCDQIWGVLGDQVAVTNAQVMGVVHLHVRTYARADVLPLPYVENGRTDCSEFGTWLEIH